MRKCFNQVSKHICVLISFIFFASAANAQNTVKGKVTDSKDGTPLAGVTVTQKGTPNSVQTDAGGNYSINVPATATLIFSSASYAGREMAIRNQTNLDISLNVS